MVILNVALKSGPWNTSKTYGKSSKREKANSLRSGSVVVATRELTLSPNILLTFAENATTITKSEPR